MNRLDRTKRINHCAICLVSVYNYSKIFYIEVAINVPFIEVVIKV